MSRKILTAVRFQSGYGTHKYDVKYTGEWSENELINAIDNGVYENPTDEELRCNNYGGYVKEIYKRDGVTRAEVGVYYD